MTKAEQRDYDCHMDSIMVQIDVLLAAQREGRADGRDERDAEIAEMMRLSGMTEEQISAILGGKR